MRGSMTGLSATAICIALLSMAEITKAYDTRKLAVRIDVEANIRQLVKDLQDKLTTTDSDNEKVVPIFFGQTVNITTARRIHKDIVGTLRTKISDLEKEEEETHRLVTEALNATKKTEKHLKHYRKYRDGKGEALMTLFPETESEEWLGPKEVIGDVKDLVKRLMAVVELDISSLALPIARRLYPLIEFRLQRTVKEKEKSLSEEKITLQGHSNVESWIKEELSRYRRFERNPRNLLRLIRQPLEATEAWREGRDPSIEDENTEDSVVLVVQP